MKKNLMDKLNKLLTVVIPVKNEEINLPECLDNVKDFDNVVIVDSGSTDKTLTISQNCNREVVQFKWDGKFPKKRNWFLRNYDFKTPWVMFLDADERITDDWIDEVVEKLSLNLNSAIDAFICYYDNWFMGRILKHGDSMQKTAVLKVGAGEYEYIKENSWSNLDMEIHEHLIVNGEIGAIQSRLEHYDKRSIESHWKKHEQYADWESNRYLSLLNEFGDIKNISQLTSRQRLKYSLIEKWYFAFFYFAVSYILKRGFLDGYSGLRFALFKARYFALVRRKIKLKRQSN